MQRTMHTLCTRRIKQTQDAIEMSEATVAGAIVAAGGLRDLWSATNKPKALVEDVLVWIDVEAPVDEAE